MGEQRQPFRFRLPWLSAASTPARPAAPQQPRPTAETRASAQPTTAVPVQRPAFRPAGRTSESKVASQPTSPSRASRAASVPPSPSRGHGTESRIGSQPSTPPRVATQTQISSETKSPPRAQTETRSVSVPPLPTRGRGIESRVSSQPATPPRAATRTQIPLEIKSPPRGPTQTRQASVHPSPSRTASQTQPAVQEAPKPISPPLRAFLPAVQISSQPISPLRQPNQVQPPPPSQPATTQVQRPPPFRPAITQVQQPPPFRPAITQVQQPPPFRPAITQVQPPPPSEPAIQTSAIPISQSRQPSEVQSQPRRVSMPHSPPKKPESPSRDLILSSSEEPQPKTQIKSEIFSKSDYETTQEMALKPERVAAEPTKASGQVKATTETATEPEKKSADEKKVAEEVKKDGVTSEEHTQKTVGGILAAAGTRTKQLLGSAFHPGEKKQEKQEVLEAKKPTTTEFIKSVSSVAPRDKKSPGTTHQKLDTPNVEKAPFHKQIKEDMTKLVHRLNVGNQKHPMEEKPVSMITLAGDNKGAFMHLGSETAKKEESVPIHRGYKLNSGDIPDTTTDGEESFGKRKSKDPKTKADQTTKAYINSNTQGINNSIVLEGSVNEHDPGVHLDLSHNLQEHTKTDVKTGPLATHKSDFSVAAAEKLTYTPTIRRRCLQGLLLEPSDSDPDNPEKPQRHGCLYNCGEKSKDKDTNVL